MLAHGGEAVGLYRTEFLFIGRHDLPDEEEQYESYRRVLEALAPKPVTIRTFDLGGDKLPSACGCHRGQPGPGPARDPLLPRQPDMFRAQLRAAARVGAREPRIMFPMISGVAELRAARGPRRGRASCAARASPIRDDIPLGIMIEACGGARSRTGSREECDFFSIGTNDLIQYTARRSTGRTRTSPTSTSRCTSRCCACCAICEAARAAGIPVSMCGEMAGEPVNALVLIGLGVSSSP